MTGPVVRLLVLLISGAAIWLAAGTMAADRAGAATRVVAESRAVVAPASAEASGATAAVAALPCGMLDVVCDGIAAAPRLAGAAGLAGAHDLLATASPSGLELPNPMQGLGEAAAAAAVGAWTAAMLAIWNSGLFILRIVLTFSEMFLTPDVRADGPGRDVYAVTLWLALVMVVVLTVIQLGAAAFKREGKGLARALIGAGQFVVACAGWFGYCAVVVAACGALTKALMRSLLDVNSWPEWEPLQGLGAQDVTDATVATVLAFLGVFLWLAAIGHLLIYLARAASLLVLTATGPLSAAGLVSDYTRAWFWKSLRWFHAAAFTPALMVIVLGIGVQLSTGVAASLADGAQKSIGTALPAVMLILVSVVAPLALFKLLAFVDPSTSSGASFRQGLAVQGGLQGLLSGGGSSGGSAAETSDAHGRSSGEQSAEGATSDRFGKSTQGLLSSMGPPGQALAAGVGAAGRLGANAVALLLDETSQTGVGQGAHSPDLGSGRGAQPSPQTASGAPPTRDDERPESTGDDAAALPVPPPIPGGGSVGGSPSTPGTAGRPGPGGAAGGTPQAAGPGGAGGGAAGAAGGAVPPPV